MVIGVAIRRSGIDVRPIASHLAGCMMRRHDWGRARPCRDTACKKMDSARPSNYLIASKAYGKALRELSRDIFVASRWSHGEESQR